MTDDTTKYLSEEQCDELGNVLLDLDIGHTDFYNDDKNNLKGICGIIFDNIGNVDIETLYSKINIMEINTSEIKDLRVISSNVNEFNFVMSKAIESFIDPFSKINFKGRR